MPLAGLLQVSGISGPARHESVKGNFPVVAFTHEVKADLDPVTNKPSGHRVHGPLNVSVNVSFGSPELHQAHKEGKKLSVTLKLYHLPRSGPEYNYFTITLSEARIVGIKLVMPPTYMSEMIHEFEELSFAYTGISYRMLPPPEGMEKGTYKSYVMMDPDDVLAKPIKFGPEWIEEKAKDGVKKAYAAVKTEAQKQFDEELKKLEGGK